MIKFRYDRNPGWNFVSFLAVNTVPFSFFDLCICVCVEIFSSKNATIFKHDSTFLRDSWSYAFVVILLLEVRD